MIRDGIIKLNTTRINNHLLDIFSSFNFLELGNINYDILVRLLNYEMVNLEDITFFPIQNRGIGRSVVKDEELRNVLPFLFFENVNKKNKSIQLFITYGLLRHKDLNNEEIFSPLVLIPVSIYIEDDKFFIQQISRPIENMVLIKYLSEEKKINISISEKLDTIYSIDKFCLSFEKHNGLNLEIENYFTYAFLREQDIKINHEKFDVVKAYDDYLYDKLYNPDVEPIYYSLRLNRLQRYAVHSANKGSNLVINGRLGTGKTTTLINIAVNAMNEGKRVLYVSNLKETLDNVYKFFEEKEMNHYITNFSKSFASFHQGELIINSKTPSTKEEDTETIFNNYKFINAYERQITNRILDFRFIEVINELALISDKEKTVLKIDDLSNLYKSEYIDTLYALEEIETELDKIESFQNSTWKDIPIINNIKYPNQVITLIYQVHKSYVELQKQKKILEDEFGFKEIRNYAYLKILLHNIKNLNIDDVPSGWYKDSNIYEDAKEEFKNLKNELLELEELEYLISSKYDQVESIDIKHEIEIILSEIYTENDLETIDKINEDRGSLILDMNKSLLHLDVFKKSINKIKDLLVWDFHVRNETIDELIRLSSILHRGYFNRNLITIIIKGEFNELYNKALEIFNNVEKLNDELKGLVKDLPETNLGDVEKTIKSFDNYNSEKPVRRSSYRLINNLKEKQPDDFKNLTKNIKRIREINLEIKNLNHQFIDLTNYKCEKMTLDGITYLNTYINSLSNKVLKTKFVKYLVHVSESQNNKNKSYLKTFETMIRSYRQVNNFYNKIALYKFSNEEEQFQDKVNVILRFNTYIQKLYKSNDRMKSIMKNNELNYYHAEDYFILNNSINKIKKVHEYLKNNQKYKNLFDKMYQDSETNINFIGKIIQNYKQYYECFENETSVVNSFDRSTYDNIIKHLDICSQASDDLNEIFKLYFKIFKDSVSRFYYNDFESNIIYLSKLLNSKDELIIYLNITENIKTLKKYKLESLINYILTVKDYHNLVLDFKYTYLSFIRDLYLEKYPYLNNYKSLEACLELAVEAENELINDIELSTFKNIRRNSGLRFSVFGIKNLDYSAYVRRTSGIKRLFLSNTQILNNFLNIKDFDLVIIDDAHLSNSDEYYLAIQGYQVVIAGELQLQSAVSNNLISRMRSSKNLIFNYRFTPIPKSLLKHIDGTKGRIYNKFEDNFGLKVINDKLLEYISLLYNENNNCVVNLFLKSLEKQREIYEKLVDLFINLGFNNNKIINIMTSKLNISDLRLGYLYDADYNIIVLEEYYDVDTEHLVLNMIDDLLLCKKCLVIYDNKDLLEQYNNSKFITDLKKIVNHNVVFKDLDSTGLIRKILDKLEDIGLKAFESNEFSFIIRKNSNLYGIILFWDDNNLYHEILNAYRDYYLLNKENNFKVIIIWSMELMNSIEDVTNRILEEINNG